MSSLHHDVSWPSMKRGLTVDHLNHERFYKPVDQRQRFTLTQFTIVASQVVELIVGGAKAHIRAAQAGATVIFRVNPRNSLEACIRDTLALYVKQDVRQVLMYRTTGVTPKDQLACTQKAMDITREFFGGLQTIFSLEDGKESLHEWMLNQAEPMANFGYEKMGFIRSAEPLSWKEEDLALFGIVDCNINPRRISCAQFALLMAKELQAKDIIFAKHSNQVVYEMPKYLQKWGYRRVDVLDVGDFVLYYNNNKPSHMGVFVGEGLVLSKLGLMNSFSHRHPLFDVSLVYGDKAVFYRKSSAKLF